MSSFAVTLWNAKAVKKPDHLDSMAIVCIHAVTIVRWMCEMIVHFNYKSETWLGCVKLVWVIDHDH